MHAAASRTVSPHVDRSRFLTKDEANRVIEAAARVGRQGERDSLLLLLMYRHGLRCAEAIDLRWADFDLEAPKNRTLTVRRVKNSKDATHTLEPDTVRRLKAFKAKSDGHFLFRSERGNPLSPDMVARIVERAGEAAKIGRHVNPHALRHACGRELAEQGLDTRLIQDYLGHRNIANTVKYTETSQRRLAAVRVR
jgi:site-specific recombinase XerD